MSYLKQAVPNMVLPVILYYINTGRQREYMTFNFHYSTR